MTANAALIALAAHAGPSAPAAAARTALSYFSPLLEVFVVHPVGKSLPTDPDAFEHSVAGQLIHHQVGVHHTYEEEVRDVS